MQVILLERVAKLGQMGDVVDVKPGFARNYLLPQNKALMASKANIAAFEARKAELEARNLETRKEAEALSARLDGQQFVVIRQASDGGALYGSVTTRDAADAATEAGVSIDRKQVQIDRPIKELGLHKVQVRLHPEVEAEITLNVARSQEEAELQAAGKTIQEVAAEEEAQAEFEISELFEDIGAAGLDEDEGPAPERPAEGDDETERAQRES
ncbi:50S ribosomal protein L9 [Rhodosalinus halophilus]|uniref:Large ribosomal subunit protein bL9 n=1 Tax=Rhodosalinus halophilus TaxID=2259333 RepID=A0A365UDS6_9RHOB|nr:50S ribosomal protein L9 [Rhodosalinus halophilus]RBI87696.1 50S ribosomal protein L9 [Rhodosalinus halophilus]